MNLKIKITTGFRKDQVYSIPVEEAHKAYYLFLNPDARTVFSNGLAIRGSEIQRIEPDFQGTMGWNENHQLGTEDWNELNATGVARKLNTLLSTAKDVAQNATPQELNLKLSDLITSKYPQLQSAN